jgi:hypothetical protein
MQKAEVSDFHEALREHVLEEPAEKLDGIEGGSAWARTSRLTRGKGDGAVFESHEATVGDGDPADRGGEVGEGCVAMGACLRVDVPGAVADLWIEVLQQSGVSHVFFEEGTVDGREGFHGDKEVGSGGLPGHAVLREATARNEVVEVGVVRELPAPGMQDAGETWEVGADTTLVFGEAFESEGRGVEQGLVGEAWMGAEEGTEGLGDSKGDEEVRPWELSLQVMRKPLLGFVLLALGAVAIATGMMDAVLVATAWALREAVAIVPALAVLDGAEDLAVRGGQMGLALQGLWGEGSEDVTPGDHGRRPGMRELRRSYASSWPVWVRCKETMVVSRWVCPR